MGIYALSFDVRVITGEKLDHISIIPYSYNNGYDSGDPVTASLIDSEHVSVTVKITNSGNSCDSILIYPGIVGSVVDGDTIELDNIKLVKGISDNAGYEPAPNDIISISKPKELVQWTSIGPFSVTVPENSHYTMLRQVNIPDGMSIVSIVPSYWNYNTNTFSIIHGGRGRIYIIAEGGTSVTELTVTIMFLHNNAFVETK